MPNTPDLRDAGVDESGTDSPESEVKDAETSKPGGVEKPVIDSPAVERIIQQTGVDNISPEHKATLAAVLAGIDISNTGEKPENNPRIMGAAVNQLREWGYQVNSIDRDSLKLETEADKRAAEINELVTKSKMPTLNYESNVGIYNFETVVTGEGRLSYVKTLKNGVIDRFENLLRASGDIGGNVLSSLFRSAKRGKAEAADIAKNIGELGLGKYFEVVEEGGEVKSINENMEDVQSGAFLDDLLRAPEGNEFLGGLNPDDALQAAAVMLREVHASSGRGVGEVLANDVVLQIEDGKIKGARLALPDMKFEEGVDAVEQKAYDVLDLCFSVGSAGLQKGGEGKAQGNIAAVLGNYDNPDVKAKVLEMAKNGIPQCTMHNKVRLGFDRVEDKEQAFEQVRGIVINVLGG